MLSDNKLIEMTVHSICGGLAGGISTMASYPFTNLRLRRIAEDLDKAEEKDEKKVEELKEAGEKKREGYIERLLKRIEIIKYTLDTIKNNGFFSLYNGISSSIFGSIVQYAIYFCSSKFWSYALDHFDVEMSGLAKTMLINMISATCTAIVTNPVWVVNARMVNKRKEEKGLGNFGMIKLIYQEEGLSGFFKGITPSLVLTLVPVMQFTVYEVIKKSFTDDEGKIMNKHIFMASLFSKLVTILVSYPVMTLKALCQSNSKLKTNEIMNLILKMIKEEGILGFYKGFGPKVIGSLINNSILMITYERLQNIVRILLTQLIIGKNKHLIRIID